MIRLLISISIVLFYCLRDPLCFFFYPELRTVTGEWDGANALAMNIYALLIFMSFIKTFLKVKYEITYLFDIGVVWFSLANIIDRSMGLYNFTRLDQVIIIPSCIILSTLTHLLYVNFREKTINKQ